MDLPEPPAEFRRRDSARLFVATVAGCGHAPFASGTVGSVPGLVLAWALWWAAGPWAVAAALAVVVAAGFWAAGACELRYGRKDPGQVVIDEVAGQMVTLLFLVPSPQTLFVGFFLFRLFDVLKPWPARRLEALPGASGIMADDLAAGLWAQAALRALHWGFPAWWGAG